MSELIVYEHRNEKQNHFHDVVMKCVARLPEYDFRYFFYGGGQRGGKTFVCLYILIQLAKLYPGSRWHIIREDFPALEKTSIPSMEKLIGKDGEYFKWMRGKGNYQVVFKNGSRIFFMAENLQNDKNLDDFLGLETNGILLEQMETLSSKAYDRALERLGSWIIDPMPIPILLGTFNPTLEWPKSLIYDKFVKGELQSPFFYQPALPDDNPFVTQDQWSNWQNMDEQSYNMMIRGIWVFKVEGNIWAYAFDTTKIVRPQFLLDEKGNTKYDENKQPIPNPFFAIDRRLPVYLIFDFNVDPMTCLVAQRDGIQWGKIINEYRLPTSDIFELCERIESDLKGYFLIVTGDASGRNRNAGNKGAKSFVDTIMTELKLSSQQNQFPSVNPSIKNTRQVVNSLFSKHPNFYISSACQFLIKDLQTIKTDEHGDLEEKQFKKDKMKGHLLANCRYFCWNYFRSFIGIKN